MSIMETRAFDLAQRHLWQDGMSSDITETAVVPGMFGRINGDQTSRDVGDPRLWAFYEYWLSIQISAVAPPQWSIDLVPQMATWLPDMFEVKFDDGEPRLFRFGSRLVQLTGVDFTGRFLKNALMGPGSELIADDCLQILRTGLPCWSDDELKRGTNHSVFCQRLMVPFVGADGKLSRIVGALYLSGTDNWGRLNDSLPPLKPGWLGTITKFVRNRLTPLF